MQKSLLLRAAPLAALTLLAACNTQPTTITGGGPNDPTANQIAAAPPVKLPPAVLASKQYRCKDNSLAFVDFMNDGVSANYKPKADGPATALTAPAAGQPYVGGDISVTGAPTDKSITLKKGGSSQQCDG